MAANPPFARSTAAESALAAIACFLAFAEESRVVHDWPVWMFFQHVTNIIVVIRDAAAQACGLYQASPQATVGLVMPGRNKLCTHCRSIICAGVKAICGASLSVRTGLRRAAAIVFNE